MAIRNLNTAENWEKVYAAFEEISFVSYDFDTVKSSLISYLQLHYSENFTDFIESSEMIAILELFAYVAEQLAYRIDINSHENFITTAQRKQSILKMAKLISYNASRNIPPRGLTKITSISITDSSLIDSQGNNLGGITVQWNDPNNPQWKEQFYLVLNRALAGKFGQPQKSFQVGDVLFQLYTFNNVLSALRNGVYSYTVDTGSETFPMEIVPADTDENGPFERSPDINGRLGVLFADDGLGDGSDLTGFMLYTKQGTLSKIEYDFASALPNRSLDIGVPNVNDTDIWVNSVDKTGAIIERWTQAETVNAQNLYFAIERNRKKFEVETLENDRIKLIFGDGDFSDIPTGKFYIWVRQSANRNLTIQRNRIVNEGLSFKYLSSLGLEESCAITFSLTSTLQNGAASEDIEHIRNAAPTTYYAQGRMVNGQDYNTFMLRDPAILRLKTINRTFAGQPKYIDWNDASGQYENIKLFGDDLEMTYKFSQNSITSAVSTASLIDMVIEPILSQPGIISMMTHMLATHPTVYGAMVTPRTVFIEEDVLDPYPFLSTYIHEKNKLQGLLNSKIYGTTSNQPISPQPRIGLYYSPVRPMVGNGYITIQNQTLDSRFTRNETITIELTSPTTYSIVGTKSGVLAPGVVDVAYPEGLNFTIHSSTTAFDRGDSFILDLRPAAVTKIAIRTFLEGNGILTLQSTTALYATYSISESVIIKFTSATEYSVTGTSSGIHPTGTVGSAYSNAGLQFTIVAGSLPFLGSADPEIGDTFILDIIVPSNHIPIVSLRNYFVLSHVDNDGSGTAKYSPKYNLTGLWTPFHTAFSSIITEPTEQFDPTIPETLHSWLIYIKEERGPTGVSGHTITYRDLKLTVYSPTTKFWYNSAAQLLDSQTGNTVSDRISILRSNADSENIVLTSNKIYDVVGDVKDNNGVPNYHYLQVMPTDTRAGILSGDGHPDNAFQFEIFVNDKCNYFRFDVTINDWVWATGLLDSYGNETALGTSLNKSFKINPLAMTQVSLINGETYKRLPVRVPLDFMWQHFTPFTNMIDPSPSNIHDMYVLTQGYYDNVAAYLVNQSSVVPVPPSPFELRNQFSKLLNSKMLSDTVVLHSAKIKLLFGDLAQPQLRAKFRVIKSPSGSLTPNQIKSEILNVVNLHFQIKNWDFGETFYATELLSLIHQRLPYDISSVVLVPVYSSNSFGSLFTIYSGIDEILQSAATITDIEIVEALSPSVLRQIA